MHFDKVAGTKPYRALINVFKKNYEKQGVKTELIRAIDHNIAIGVYPDMLSMVGNQTNGCDL